MLTLRQALQFLVFAKARVVAGERGLDQVIRRVHVVDIPDAEFHVYGEGLLLFTSGYGIKDKPAEVASFIPKLVDSGLIGLIFSLGWSFDEVPAVMRAEADRLDFPLIVVPADVKFITLIERLYVELVNEQAAVKERAGEVHRRLMQLVLEGGGLEAVAATLADLLRRSVLFESLAFEVLAAAQHGPVDENRQRAVAAGRTPPEMVERLMARGVYGDLDRQLRALRLPAIPDLGMTMERVVAPIVVGGEVYGYIWIVAGDRPLTDLDELALDNAAIVAALVLLKEQAVREARQAVRGDFLAQLLRPEFDPDGAPDSGWRERAHLVGYHFDQPHQALFVRCPAASGAALAHLVARLERWFKAQALWGLVVARERGLAVIIESKTDAAGQSLGERLVADLSNPAQPLLVGVGRAYAAARQLPRSLEEAREAVEIGERFGRPPRLTCFWTLGLLDWLYHLPPEVLAANPFLSTVQRLAEHDRRTNGDLVRTLDAYLEHGGALSEAAGALNVHRNTLLYRIGRIEEITAVDLKDIAQRLNLHVALKAYLLRR